MTIISLCIFHLSPDIFDGNIITGLFKDNIDVSEAAGDGNKLAFPSDLDINAVRLSGRDKGGMVRT